MNMTCPHCASPLNFSVKQQAQIDEAVNKLQPGVALKLKCPKCGGLVEFNKPVAQSAPAPEMSKAAPKTEAKAEKTAAAPAAPAAEPAKPAAAPSAPAEPVKPAATPAPPVEPAAVPAPAKQPKAKAPRKAPKPAAAGELTPPPPPPLDWLASGIVDDTGKVGDVPLALALYAEGAERDAIVEALQNLGYQVASTTDVDDALQRMRFTQFACIVYQANMHGELPASAFHAYMCAMTMARRRRIFYILVGDELSTLYDLEALTCSANLTVNPKELPMFPLILRKAFQNHEDLFGAYVEELSTHLGIGG